MTVAIKVHLASDSAFGLVVSPPIDKLRDYKFAWHKWATENVGTLTSHEADRQVFPEETGKTVLELIRAKGFLGAELVNLHGRPSHG
jgi:hypothetical protein